MLPSPSEADVVHHQEFELARSVKRELMQLQKSQLKTPTADDVMLIARKAELAGILAARQHRPAFDVVSGDAWLAKKNASNPGRPA